MSANSSILLTNVDFDNYKNNLINYLKAQSQFQDFNFNDSNLAVLLDILALNTFQNGFYLNMVASEMFLDSALLRTSAISHSKALNYTPRSALSAMATVNLTFSANTNVVTVPVGTSFTTLVGPNLLTFVTATETVYLSSNNYFNIQNLDIYEGKITNEQYVVNYENTEQRFIISDPTIDTRSLTVTVVEDNNGNSLNYTQATTTLDQDENSQIYFLQATENNSYELIFGDDIIGRRPKDGAFVQVQYRVTSASLGNGASKFTLDTEFTNFITTPTVSVVSISDGGTDAETIDSIKYYAPRFFQIQERAINVNDYEIILQQKFPEIQAIAAYGGEEISPPQYGKVMIAVDIANVDGLPQSKITEYTNYIKPRSPLSIDPIFVQPDYLYYSVTSTVNYDITSTSLAEEQIQSYVVNEIINYNANNFNDFKSNFWYSKFVAGIDDIEDAAILSNDTDIQIYKKIYPTFGSSQNITVNFNIELTTKGGILLSQYSSDDLVAIQSSSFVYNGETVFIADDNNGTLRLVKTEGTNNVVILPNIGSVDYTNGILNLVNFRLDAYGYGQNCIDIFAIPATKDFSTSQNVILTLEPSQIFITVNAITSSD